MDLNPIIPTITLNINSLQMQPKGRNWQTGLKSKIQLYDAEIT